MSISVSCECGNRLLLSEDFAGERVNCPYCGREVETAANVAALPSSTASGRRGPKRVAAANAPIGNGAATRGVNRNGLISPPFLRPYPRHAPWRPANSGGVQVLIGLASAFAVASAALHRLEGAVWGTALVALGLLFGLIAFIHALWRHQGLAAPGVAFLFCASLAGLIVTEPGSANQLSAIWNRGPDGKGWGGLTWGGGKTGDRAKSDDVSDSNSAKATRTASGDETSTHAGSSGSTSGRSHLWTPNSEPIRQGDWEFRITRIVVGKPRVSDSFDTSNAVTEWKSPGLLLSLEVRNQSQMRTYDYKRFIIKLSDNLNGNYERVDLGSYRLVDRQAGNARLAPGHSLHDLLFFDPPRESVEFYHLTLDAGHADFGDPVQIRIPAELVQ